MQQLEAYIHAQIAANTHEQTQRLKELEATVAAMRTRHEEEIESLCEAMSMVTAQANAREMQQQQLVRERTVARTRKRMQMNMLTSVFDTWLDMLLRRSRNRQTIERMESQRGQNLRRKVFALWKFTTTSVKWDRPFIVSYFCCHHIFPFCKYYSALQALTNFCSLLAQEHKCC